MEMRLPPSDGALAPQEPSSDAWLLRVLRISTSHLSPWTWNRIVGLESLGHLLENWGDGWVCSVQPHDEVLAVAAPDDLKQAIALARRYDAQFVKFELLGPVARRLPTFAFSLGSINYPRDGRKELPVKLGRGVAVLELSTEADSWLDLLSLDDEGRVLRRSTVATPLARRPEPFRLLTTVIEIARLLDADDGARLALHDDLDAQGAIARGDLVLAMQLLQTGTPIQRLDFRSRSNDFYGQVSYPFRA